MDKYHYDFINVEDEFYKKAIQLRYDVFFKSHGCLKDATIDEFDKSAFHLICYKDDDDLIGYGRLNVKDKVAQISQLVVNPSYRNRGVASNIIKKLETKGKDLSIEKIFLNARVTAIDLYKNNGYKVAGEEFLSSKTNITHIKMEKQVKE